MNREKMAWSGAMAGIFGVVSFNVLFTISLYLHPEWRFGIDFMSELGVTSPDTWLFNYSVMMMGSLGIVFGLGLYQFFNGSVLGRASMISLIAGCTCLFLLGLFPMQYGELHDNLTWGFFIMTVLALLIMSVPLFLSGRKGRLAFISTVVTVVFSISCVLMIWIRVMRHHLAEVLVVYALGAWIVMTSIQMIFRLRKEGLPLTAGSGS